MAEAPSYTVVVAGATGVIGRELIRLLLLSQRCVGVTALVRSSSTATLKFEATAAKTPIDAAGRAAKLKVVVFDWEKLCTEGSDGTIAATLAGHSLAVNCLGTTRADAGGLT